MSGTLDGAAEDRPSHELTVRVLAWGVHFYTALGLVIAAAIVSLLVQGGADAFRWSFILMVLATVVDATDGTLARKIKVWEVLPNFDGRKLDDLTDFLTYTFLPLMLVWRAELLPAGWEPILVFPLLASAYGFCQVEAKTEDGYFLGFPSLWNVVAFYLYTLKLGEWVSLGLVVLLSVLTFVPSRYLYPTYKATLIDKISNPLSAIWVVHILFAMWNLPSGSGPDQASGARSLAVASLYYPAFYMSASWIISIRHWMKRAD